MITNANSVGRISEIPGIKGNVYIVTGSSRGIGREIARILLASGCSVVLNGRNSVRLEKTAGELSSWMIDNGIITQTEHGKNRLSHISADVSTESGSSELIAHTVEAFGRIDGLINNAGISMRGQAGDLRIQAIEGLYRGNILAAVLPTVAALPELERSRGNIVFVSTLAALWGFPGVSMYSATKAAVESFARAVDAETRKKGITTTTVFFGFVENDPDKETLAPSGEPFRYNRKAQQTQVQAAYSIIRALVSGRRRFVATWTGKLLEIATRIAPGLLSLYLARGRRQFHTVTKTST